MNELDLDKLRQRLLSLRSELQSIDNASRDATRSVDPDQASSDGISRRDAMRAQIAAEEGGRLRKRQIQKIDGALRRIQSGEFGKCFICEEEIDRAGLSADPTITRCANCIEEEYEG